MSEPVLTPRDYEASAASQPDEPVGGMIPPRKGPRTKIEGFSMRILATSGIVAVATVLGATLVAANVAGWIVGLTVGLVSVVLAAVLWSSKQL